MRELPRSAVSFFVGVEGLVLALTVVLVARTTTVTPSDVLRLGGLLLIGSIYAEVVDRVERVWIWMHTDRGAFSVQIGVLLFTGVLTLPMWAALVQTAVAYAHSAARNRRNRSAPTYRVVWNATTVLIAAAAASAVLHGLGGDVRGPGVLDILALACTLVVYSGVNLAVLIGGMYVAMRPPSLRALVPSRRQFGYEIVKLLLGLLGAVLVDASPLLLPLIPLLAAILHRSSVVYELTTDANTDAKTGLLTPKAWSKATSAQLARCSRDDAPVALMVLDLDHFKAVNDRLGHAAGDKVLEAVGALLNAQVRANDVVGRYGGEEFVVLLPDTTSDDASEIADRVRRRIAGLRPVEGLQITASFGVVCARAIDAGIEELFASADSAMYRAKAAGRDRVVVAA